MYELVDVSKEYRVGKTTKKALHGIHLQIADAGLICICGKSGSGKTTLLNILALADTSSSGKVVFQGVNIANTSEKQRDAYRCWRIGRISQDYDLIPELCVFDNCAIGAVLQNNSKSAISEKVKNSLAAVQLEGFEKRKINSLSGGEKQRVAIARALTTNASVFLCDEPTGNLDPDSSMQVMKILKTLSKTRAVIVVTHNRSLAEKFADRIIDLSNGGITSDRTIHSLDSQAPCSKSKKGKRNIARRVSAIIQDAWLLFRKKKILTGFTILLISLLLTVLLIVSYMSNYSYSLALAASLQKNKNFWIMLTDTKEFFGPESKSSVIDYANRSYPYDTVLQIETECADLPLADCFRFQKSFYNFSNAEKLEPTFYRCISFLNFLIIDDFSKVHCELVAGRYPAKTGEVLIYDYMAENIQYFHLFDDVLSVNDLIGHTLVDKDDGFSMTISGIIQSTCHDYEDLHTEESIVENDAQWYAGNAQLALFRSVLGGPEFRKNLKEDRDKGYYERTDYSIANIQQGWEKSGEIISYRNNTVLSLPNQTRTDDLGITMYPRSEGVFVRDTVFAKMLGISVESLRSEIIQQYFGEESQYCVQAHYAEVYNGYSHFSLTFSTLDDSHTYTAFDGIFHAGEDFPYDMVRTEYSSESLDNQKFENLKGKVLLLTDSVSKNAEMIQRIEPQRHTAADWTEDPEKEIWDYSTFSSFRDYLDAFDPFLKLMNKIYHNYSWILLSLVAVLLLGYVFLSVKYNERTLGILRTNGASVSFLISVFSLIIVGTAFFSMILSVGISIPLTNMVNQILSEENGIQTVFYSIQARGVMTSLILVVLSMGTAIFGSALWIRLKKPISLIYHRRD